VTETTTRRLMQREERQAQILQAAAAAFARTGFAGTSMDDVAAEAGITRLIVYRHFDSKEDLYRSVLTQVTGRLSEEWWKGVDQSDRRGFVFTTLLTAAREHPDGFRLLYQHAAREPKFAEFAEQVHLLQVDLTDQVVGDTIPDQGFRPWVTRTIVGYLVDSVLAWLEVGDPERDAEFIERATDGLVGLYRAWAPDAVVAQLEIRRPST
jgi:AcrR family transcriptional regulator